VGEAEADDATGQPGAVEEGDGQQWRIDDLARLAGTTVDTIRFYQREGLLPPATRRGRSMLYGPLHLERLERIRDLQARHFTLKGIRALAQEGRLTMLDRLFTDQTRTYSRDELVAESGLTPEQVERLEEAGLLSTPESRGALRYDTEDLSALAVTAASLQRGMPEAVALALARLYHRHLGALHEELLSTFAVNGTGLAPALDDDDLDAFRTLAANDIDAFLRDSCVVLEYLHRRGIQQLVVEAMRLADAVGGSYRRADAEAPPAS
jgi:DNA-binding transcriptional MerR regulator